eukprot:5031143-Pyramimonas_sp.AAC.1
MAMLPKSIKDERAITKCPTIYRIYCKARGFDIDSWNREHLEFWGTAVKGSSALKANLHREVCNEVVLSSDMAAVCASWDMEKFFGSVSPRKLMHLALQHGYPAYLLYLGLLIHTSPRALEVSGVMSKVSAAGESILAGCGQGMPW